MLTNEESLLVLRRVVDNAHSGRVVRQAAVFEQPEVVSVVATSVAVDPLELDADLRRKVLVPWRFAGIPSGRLDLAHKRLDRHELVSFCLQVVAEVTAKIVPYLSLVGSQCLLFLLSSLVLLRLLLCL